MKYKVALLYFAFTFILLTSFIPTQAKPKPLAELPFEMHKNLIILKVKINGYGPLNMMLDTGTDVGVIDLAAAKKIGLQLTSEGKPVAGSGTSANVAYDTTFSKVDLGKWQVKNMEAAAVDLSAIGKAIGIELHGILGHNLLDKRIVQIDFPAKIVRFYSEMPIQEKGNQKICFSRTTLPFRYKNDSVLIEDVYVKGKKVTTLFDTGFNGTFNVMPNSIEKLELEDEYNNAKPKQAVGYNGKSTNREGTIKTVKVGDFSVDSPTVIFWEKDTGHDSESYGFAIGNGFLKDFKVTLDYLKNILVLEKICHKNQS